MMTALFRLRLALLGLAIVLVAGLTIWGVQTSWRRIHELESKLTSGHLESFRLADDFQSRLLTLNGAMLHYVARREESTWTDFEQAGGGLDRWIDRHDPRLSKDLKVTTERNSELCKQPNE